MLSPHVLEVVVLPSPFYVIFEHIYIDIYIKLVFYISKSLTPASITVNRQRKNTSA